MSNLILEVEVRCHKVQGMTEAFTDTLYSRAKTSSSVHQKAVFYRFSRARQQINLPGLCYQKKLPSCPAPCDSAPPPPESSCSRCSYQRFLVCELKYTFPCIRFARRAHEYISYLCMYYDVIIVNANTIAWAFPRESKGGCTGTF